MKTELLCLGTELLEGKTNLDSSYLGDRLSMIGLNLDRITTVSDHLETIKKAFSDALNASDIIIITGGLGPTFDDVTREAISEHLNIKLVLNKKILAGIEKRFSKNMSEMPESNIKQAYILDGAKPLTNNHGTAPGQLLELNDLKKIIILLPGPLRELQHMFEKEVFPYLKQFETKIRKTLTLRVCGLSESDVNQRILSIVEAERKTERETVSFTILAHQMIVDIKIIVSAQDEMLVDEILHNLKKEFEDVLESNVYGYNRDTLESVIARLLVEHKKTLAIAESCTGGLLAHKITNVPGSSMYFKEGVVTYSNDSKIKVLGVKEETLDNYGAVSEQTVLEMARSIKDIAKSDFSISISGIAGPTGGTKDKPVGLVYIGLVTPENMAKSFKYDFSGNRIDIREKSAVYALDLLRRELLNYKPQATKKKKLVT
ncbi:competence/damage-inducible protein A [Elusimicrobiota bacterium]